MKKNLIKRDDCFSNIKLFSLYSEIFEIYGDSFTNRLIDTNLYLQIVNDFQKNCQDGNFNMENSDPKNNYSMRMRKVSYSKDSYKVNYSEAFERPQEFKFSRKTIQILYGKQTGKRDTNELMKKEAGQRLTRENKDVTIGKRRPYKDLSFNSSHFINLQRLFL